MPFPGNAKQKVTLACEVTRVREPEPESGNISFDLRLTGGNAPKDMAALRQLIQLVSSTLPDQEAGLES